MNHLEGYDMYKPVNNDILTASYSQNYPLYLEQFSELFTKIENERVCSKNLALMSAAWDFALFGHALINNSYLIALEFLKKVNRALNDFITQIEPQSSSYESAHRLYKFSFNLQKQYEGFLQKKKLLKAPSS